MRNHEFESQRTILEESLFTFICCNIAMVTKTTQMNKKEAGDGIFQNIGTKYKLALFFVTSGCKGHHTDIRINN